MDLPKSYTIAWKSLKRNRLQTGLTMLGMSIGVATVLTMIALGSGAQRAIQDQVKAAGMNVILVTAGNYQGKKDKPADDAIEMGAMREPGFVQGLAQALWWRMGRTSNSRDEQQQRQEQQQEQATAKANAGILRYAQNDGVYGYRDGYEYGDGWQFGRVPHLVEAGFHPEDDPFAVHDHPTARQRLGDSEAGLGAAATLTIDDADAVRRIPGVQYVCEGVHENVHAVSGDTRWFTRVHGDGSTLPSIRRAWKFTHGDFFSARQEKRNEQVAVLGSVVAEKLFGAASPIGKTVSLWKQDFKVIGVVTSSSWMVNPEAGDDQFDAVYVPVTTMQHLLNLSKLNDITVTTASTGDVTHVSKLITTLLRTRHGIGSATPDDFTVASQASGALTKGGLRPDVASAVTGNVAGLDKLTLDQLGKTLDKSSRTMTALLASIATVSLIVGGIGIMNIMMLSVTERTREIGIRRAVGARASEVLMQFIVESVTLSVAGGLIGIAVGVMAAVAISHEVQWSTSISPMAVLLSFGISAAVGIFFGYYPAKQASQVAPLASLRYE